MESGGSGRSGNHEGSQWDQEDQGIIRKVSGIRRIRKSQGKSVGSGDQEKVGSGQLGNQGESPLDQDKGSGR